MRHKILWLMVSFLLVAALVLASCAPAVPGEQEEEEEEEEEPVGQQEEEEEEEEEPAVGEPQHGGTLSMIHFRTEMGHDSWDWTVGWHHGPYLGVITEYLTTVDVLKYGPRGTNVYDFTLNEYTPLMYLKGHLAESWEWLSDPLRLVFKIRPGVMWAANPHIGFEAREYTAYDAEFSLTRFKDAISYSSWMIPFVEYFEATDRYTLVAYFEKFDPSWPFWFGAGWLGAQYPSEVIEAGVADWRNQIGTGPFIVTNHIPGSVVTYKRNPNWWNRKQTIYGKEYELPFIDELVYPIIADPATQIAALRTAKVDWHIKVPMRYQASLAETCPELKVMKYSEASVHTLWFQWRHPPFSIKEVRQAMMIGTDLEAIVKAVHGEGTIHAFPFNSALPKALVTPLEELPPETRKLFEYNPDLAKQMLTDAGYPDGFEITLHCDNLLESTDKASQLAGMWEKLGVEVNVRVWERAAALYNDEPEKYEGAMMAIMGNALPLARLDMARHLHTWGFVPDVYYNELVDDMMATMDPIEQAAKAKAIAVYWIDQAKAIPVGCAYVLNMWWPWVKNYYGELEVGTNNYVTMLANLWIDQDLKEEMGY